MIILIVIMLTLMATMVIKILTIKKMIMIMRPLKHREG